MNELLVFADSVSSGGTANAGQLMTEMLIAVFASVIIIGLIFYILQVIAGWKIFKKAGEEGWKAIIPIYNTYIFFKIVGMKNWFWAMIVVAILSSFVSNITGFSPNDAQPIGYTSASVFGAIVYFASGVFSCVITIWYSYRLSKAFGHGVPFTLGLIFLSPIFLLILGLGASKYDKKLVKSWTK